MAAGEPGNQIAAVYGLNPSSLHRHRKNCLRLASSSAIMKEVSRGTSAVACLPSKDDLGQAYADLKERIDRIVRQAEAEGSLSRPQSRIANTGKDGPYDFKLWP